MMDNKYRVMRACPRYNSCNVSICPLDPDKHKRSKVEGERSCTMSKARLAQVERDARVRVSDGGRAYRDKLYEKQVLSKVTS